MEAEVIADTGTGLVTALLEYGALGIFCTYLVVSNWLGQKRLDRLMARSESVAVGIGEQLVAQNAKLDSIIEDKKQDSLKRDLARMIEDAER